VVLVVALLLRPL